MNTPLLGPESLRPIAVAIPSTFFFAALLVARAAPFRRALQATSVMAGLVVLLVLGAIVPVGLVDVSASSALPQAASGRGVRLDVVSLVMLSMVGTLAIVIVRYSKTYLEGDPGAARYARALLATLGMVTIIVVSNNLLVIALAWIGTSLSLHRLLTFYPERPAALIAAHKKFLLSRLADACLLCALALVYRNVGSLDLDAVSEWARSHGALPGSVQLATILMVGCVVLKSAQLPFHGWLTQVMEAPTPVSALLHAGVVNIGGFLMIRLAPLMARAHVAQGLLVVVGTTTAVIAGMTMTTRVSVKVALAWSTCAQMGFMLAECGLGAWHLALLHLVAHSFYKAHAFLASGGTVDNWRVLAMAPRRERVPLAGLGVAAALVAAVAAAAYAAARMLEPAGVPDGTLGPVAVVLALSLLPFAARQLSAERPGVSALALRCAGVAGLYFAAHGVFARVLPPAGAATSPAWRLVVVAFGLLLWLELWLQARPSGRLARALQPHLFAGLYLDELFTRATFRLWPPRLQATQGSPRRGQPFARSQETTP
jgi:NAD(P)H-quinone oxidoreductase subunit 5